jgi:alpha-beta hydrolase superfamily lysophospholipase
MRSRPQRNRRKRTGLLKPVLTAAALLSAWEFGAAWYERRRWQNALAADPAYWHSYYDAGTVQRSNALRQEVSISSTGVALHVDLYPRPEPDAPVLLFNHGAAGYCRLFVPLALAFYDLGYTVILPDQRGQGLSGGRRGDYSVSECIQNIVDTAHWARSRFVGPLYMAGGSVGGAYTYYAAAAGAPALAIACLNLFDFGNPAGGLAISRLSGLRRYPALAGLVTGSLKLSAPLGWMRLPFAWFGAFDRLMDARDAPFQARWDADPIPPRLVALRSLASTLSTPPAVPFEHNRTPVLVINQALDRMVDPAATRRSYERLGGPKRYLEIPFGHWSSQPAFWMTVVGACHAWFQQHPGAQERQPQ